MQKTTSGRIDSLDGLRGIACLCVLLFHVGIMVQPFGVDADYALMPGSASVMVFYVLSGVVLSIVPFSRLLEARSYDWFGYFPRRVVRLCVPLVIAIALGVVAGFVAQTIGSQSRSSQAVDYSAGLSEVLNQILMQFDVLFNVSDGLQTLYGAPLTRVDSPVWSMSWELWFSLSLPLVIYFVWKVKRDAIVLACAAVLIFIARFSGYFPLRLCLMFVVGAFLAKHLKGLFAKRLRAPVELVAIGTCVLSIELPQLIEASGAAEALMLTLMDIGCMGLVAVAMGCGLLNRFLSTKVCRWLGKISYSMYLTHAIVIGALAAFLPRLGLQDPLIVSVIALVPLSSH